MQHTRKLNLLEKLNATNDHDNSDDDNEGITSRAHS